MLRFALAASLCASTAAVAQEKAFTGPVVGLEAGAVEHHFYLETVPPTPALPGRYFRSWGAGGGAFAGYTVAVAEDIRVGAEVSAITGGGKNTARNFGPVQLLTLSPRWGYRAVGKIGATWRDRVFVYVTGGYGGDRYRVENPSNVVGVSQWRSSFVVGTGVEIQASKRIGVRLDLKHVDNSSYQLLLGVPIRL